jgi:hypothetical protein
MWWRLSLLGLMRRLNVLGIVRRSSLFGLMRRLNVLGFGRLGLGRRHRLLGLMRQLRRLGQVRRLMLMRETLRCSRSDAAESSGTQRETQPAKEASKRRPRDQVTLMYAHPVADPRRPTPATG